MSIQNVIAQIAVSNLKGATAWYGKLLGHVTGSASRIKLERWRLPRGGWIQLRRSRSEAGGSSVSLLVNDLAAQRSAMEDAGFEFEPVVKSDAGNTAVLLDPDGNCITFEQTLRSSPQDQRPQVHVSRPAEDGSPEALAADAAQVVITALHARLDDLEAEVTRQTNRADANDLARSALAKATKP